MTGEELDAVLEAANRELLKLTRAASDTGEIFRRIAEEYRDDLPPA